MKGKGMVLMEDKCGKIGYSCIKEDSESKREDC